MAKVRTFYARTMSWHGMPHKLRSGAKVREYDPTVTLRDPKFIREAILESLDDGDYEDVVSIYRCHLRMLNRTRTAKAMGVSRQYIHKMIRLNNTPSLKTFAAFMKMLRAASSLRSSAPAD